MGTTKLFCFMCSRQRAGTSFCSAQTVTLHISNELSKLSSQIKHGDAPTMSIVWQKTAAQTKRQHTN